VARSAGHREGSEFIVRLPAKVQANPEGSEPELARAPRGGAARRRILVADDNRDTAMTLAMILEAMGNEVRVAHDGEEAIAVAAGFRPDAILLDIGMPKVNGYEVCEKVRGEAWGADAFIVALTGWGQKEDKSRARAAGFDRHLVKPVEPVMLEKLFEALPISK
jgi:CheY-like chemotaxis protein